MSVIVIDDTKPLLIELFLDLLEAELGEPVVLYGNCLDWEEAGSPCAELFLVDYNMPGPDGPECIRRVKARCPRAKIVGWSNDPFSEAPMKEAGADLFLDKEIDEIEEFISLLS